MMQQRNFCTTFLLSICLIILGVVTKSTKAGSCWMMVSNNGRCKMLGAMDISKQECCEAGVATAGWTPFENISTSQLFYWQYLGDGAPDCKPCHVSCSGFHCDEGMRCRMRNKVPRCVCAPDCSLHRERYGRGHMCGDDGRTYKSYCQMLKHNCRRNQYVQVDYPGRCKYSCDSVVCEDNKHCVLDQNALPHCVPCITTCRDIHARSSALCGADGVTYPSMCHFRRATCLHGRTIGIAYSGHCRANVTCSDITCSWGKHCLVNPSTGRPQCMKCDRDCDSYMGQAELCATDGRTYRGWCSIQRQACDTGVVIETQHYGPCGSPPSDYVEDYVEPPTGSSELWDTTL